MADGSVSPPPAEQGDAAAPVASTTEFDSSGSGTPTLGDPAMPEQTQQPAGPDFEPLPVLRRAQPRDLTVGRVLYVRRKKVVCVGYEAPLVLWSNDHTGQSGRVCHRPLDCGDFWVAMEVEPFEAAGMGMDGAMSTDGHEHASEELERLGAAHQALSSQLQNLQHAPMTAGAAGADMLSLDASPDADPSSPDDLDALEGVLDDDLQLEAHADDGGGAADEALEGGVERPSAAQRTQNLATLFGSRPPPATFENERDAPNLTFSGLPTQAVWLLKSEKSTLTVTGKCNMIRASECVDCHVAFGSVIAEVEVDKCTGSTFSSSTTVGTFAMERSQGCTLEFHVDPASASSSLEVSVYSSQTSDCVVRAVFPNGEAITHPILEIDVDSSDEEEDSAADAPAGPGKIAQQWRTVFDGCEFSTYKVEREGYAGHMRNGVARPDAAAPATATDQ